MCGVAGLIKQKLDKKDALEFQKIRKYLMHRGPDDSGYFINNNLSLVHTRLSIIDLENGKQPIDNGDYVLIANGEIYNDIDIRKQNKQYKFITKSDCESILAVYAKRGIKGFEDLRGMYSFALYDKKKEQLILSRDYFGIKPLYFCDTQKGFIFSSEIQAILNITNQSFKIRSDKLMEFFQMQYCSGHSTVFNGINRLRPGETLIIHKEKIIKSFLNINKLLRNTSKKKHVSSLLDETISKSVKLHLRSDVPSCIFFSGGVDSMLLLYYVNKVSDSKIKSFFVKVEDEKNDFDKDFLSTLSSRFNSEFEEIEFSEKDFWNLIPKAAKIVDDPVADYAILPTLKLAKKVSEDKFKVVLTGEGGDEIFAGYGRYKKSHKEFFNPALSIPNIYNFDSKNWNLALKQINDNIYNSKLSQVQKYQWFDFQNWLPNNLLVKLDRCLMAYGLEGRTPLVDKEVFKSLFFVDDYMKIQKNQSKFYVKKFLSERIINYDPFLKKRGFTVPLKKWIPKKLKTLEEFLPNIEILKNLLSKNFIKDLCYSARFRKKALRPVWHLIFFASWYAIHIKKNKADGDFFDLIENLRS